MSSIMESIANAAPGATDRAEPFIYSLIVQPLIAEVRAHGGDADELVARLPADVEQRPDSIPSLAALHGIADDAAARVGDERLGLRLGSAMQRGRLGMFEFILRSAPTVGAALRCGIRYNGLLVNQPSFTILSNRCAHLGCPVQPNGPVAENQSTTKENRAGQEVLKKTPAKPAGFGCPCHGGQYDTEGNRTAGPPVRALDRYNYSIIEGRLVLGSAYSVDYVKGEGKTARIKKYPLHMPGQHVAGRDRLRPGSVQVGVQLAVGELAAELMRGVHRQSRLP